MGKLMQGSRTLLGNEPIPLPRCLSLLRNHIKCNFIHIVIALIPLWTASNFAIGRNRESPTIGQLHETVLVWDLARLLHLISQSMGVELAEYRGW